MCGVRTVKFKRKLWQNHNFLAVSSLARQDVSQLPSRSHLNKGMYGVYLCDWKFLGLRRVVA
jgi:hypothetical protein